MNDDYSHFVFEDEYDYSQLLYNDRKRNTTEIKTKKSANPKSFTKQLHEEYVFNEPYLSAEYYYDVELASHIVVKRPVKSDSFRVELLLDIIPPVKTAITSLATAIWGIFPIISKHRIFQ